MHGNLVDNVVNEVKSQGVFDQFRKDSMADVDTKPAYQNLRQRVENTVSKFLANQKWTPDMNRNQLREKLRKHIAEAGFLDVGVERIVDQVVNPKVATVFQPKIEDIAYAYLGIEKPKPKDIQPVMSNGSHLHVKTDLVADDFEQVSPDSDKASIKSEIKDDSTQDIDEKADDFESPPFEPLESTSDSPRKCKKEEEDGENAEVQENNENNSSHPSAISGLTTDSSNKFDNDVEKNKSPVPAMDVEPAETTRESISVLSQVSSNSHLSIVSRETEEDHDSGSENHANISEEAQMPKFNENSNSNSTKITEPLHFDIKKDEIKFEGTDRNAENRGYSSHKDDEDYQPPVAVASSPFDSKAKDECSEESRSQPMEQDNMPMPVPSEESYENFNFSKININPPILNTSDSRSLEDSIDKELKIVEQTETSLHSESVNVKIDAVAAEPAKASADDEWKKKSPKSTHHSRHSSSSHSKKHSSKDRRSDRDRSSSSSTKKHSSTSKSEHSRHSSHSSSRSHNSSSKDGRDHRSSSSSHHKSKHSSRDDPRSSKNSDRKRHDKEKDKSGGTGSDDHYSSKHKPRRKSNESDDGESSRDASKRNSSSKTNGNGSSSNGGLKNLSPHENITSSSPPSSSSSVGNTRGSAEKICDPETANEMLPPSATLPPPTEKVVLETQPVILDGFFKNPDTTFIRLCGTGVEVNSTGDTDTSSDDKKHSQEHIIDERDFHGFVYDEADIEKYASEIKTLQAEIARLRNIRLGIPTVAVDLSDSVASDNEGSICASTSSSKSSGSPHVPKKRRHNGEGTSATLTIDCIEFDGISNLNKKFKFANHVVNTKISPTLSEMSVGSKENNDCNEKNATVDNEISITEKSTKKASSEKRASTVSSQRYSSEDLYKPRPVLSQRSKRRGLDANV